MNFVKIMEIVSTKRKDFSEYRVVGNLEEDINKFCLLLKDNFLKGRHFENPNDSLQNESSPRVICRASYMVGENISLTFLYEIYSETGNRKRVDNLRVETRYGTELDKKLEELLRRYIKR